MKFTVNFAQNIGLPCIQKQAPSTQTIQNLEILISLNYNNMENCKLIYEGKVLKDKNAQLHQIFKNDDVNLITVVSKSQIQSLVSDTSRTTQKYMDFFKKNPWIFAGIVAFFILVLIILSG